MENLILAGGCGKCEGGLTLSCLFLGYLFQNPLNILAISNSHTHYNGWEEGAVLGDPLLPIA